MKRYNYVFDFYTQSSFLEESVDGEYIKYEDYDRESRGLTYSSSEEVKNLTPEQQVARLARINLDMCNNYNTLLQENVNLCRKIEHQQAQISAMVWQLNPERMGR